MPIHKAPNVEPIRGYRLIEPIGKGGFGEVWRCEAPGGICKAIKFVYGDLNGLENQRFRAEEELRAVQLIKSIRHPFFLSIDRVENIDGELIIITELADQNLHELSLKHQEDGLPGVPRAELLTYLREAAEVLDLMNGKFDLQHLDIKPRNLFLVSNHVKVADFGLVNRLSAKEAPVQTGAITPFYAAPELFEGKLSRQCDQYSLAIVYQELLTGTLPLQGDNPRQIMLAHLQNSPDVSALPESDRAIVAKALAKNPNDRYASCRQFLDALDGITSAPAPTETAPDLCIGRSAESLALPSSEYLRIQPQARPSAAAPASIPGLRFGDCVAVGPLQDVWNAHDKHGRKRLVKFVYGFNSDAVAIQNAVVQLKSIHHPALVVSEVANVEPGRLTLLSDPVKKTLRDRFQECLDLKHPGILRGELVDYLRAAAEVLDYLYQQYGLHHLNLHPRQLILDQGWLQIAEFGIAQLLWLPGGQNVASRNARYAAPEQFTGQASRHSDQYTLALIFAEMLTGVHPFHGLSGAAQRGAAPDLERLAPLDREVIARALQLDPTRRWPNCTEMMLALEGASLQERRELHGPSDPFTEFIAKNKNADQPAHVAGHATGNLQRIIQEIIAKVGGETDTVEMSLEPVVTNNKVEYKFQVGLPLGAARTRLENFPQLWFGEVVRNDEHELIFRISVPTSFWHQLFGKPTGLEVCIRLARVKPQSASPIEVTAILSSLRQHHAASREMLDELGPAIIDCLRSSLVSDADKRRQDRLLWPHPIRVTPILEGGIPDEPIECRGKDISKSGMGFFLPHDLSTSDVLIELSHDSHAPSIVIPATLVRAERCADGWYDVGALFRIPAVRKSHPDICIAPVEASPI